MYNNFHNNYGQVYALTHMQKTCTDKNRYNSMLISVILKNSDKTNDSTIPVKTTNNNSKRKRADRKTK